MRTPSASLVVAIFLAAGCANSHGGGEDASSDAGADARTDGGFECTPGEPVECSSCAGECIDGVRVCPDECPPPICPSRPPREGEVCRCDAGRWICEGGGECSPSIDPRDPDAPGSACEFEGASCAGGERCSGGLFCECDGRAWQCGVAEPDPVCTCGREPTAGDPCVEEGASCGSCCLEGGGPDWRAMVCEGGSWQPAICDDFCPETVQICAPNTATIVGTPCSGADAECGDRCCGDHVVCEGGVWVESPPALCAFCDRGFTCGDGFCVQGSQVCHEYPGPDDGPQHDCRRYPSGCTDCDCLDVPPGHSCTMTDGRAYVTGGFRGSAG